MTDPKTPPMPPSSSSAPRKFRSWPRPGTGDSTWIKWNETAPGTVVEGTWKGTFSGKFNACGKVVREDGTEVKFSLPVALERGVQGLPVGAFVRITYAGLRTSESDATRQFHDFDVEVAEDSLPDDLEGDGEVPF
jgi:hypothetical protein